MDKQNKQLTVEEIEQYNRLTERIIGCCIEVHRFLGPGLLESSYEECLSREFNLQGLKFERQTPLSINYKGTDLDCGYRMDIIVDHKIVLELKSIEAVLPVHKAQLVTYLKHSGYHLGLLVNFNVDLMKNGIFRIVNNFDKHVSH